MGREIRRVVPNWEHPKQERADYRTGQMVEDYRPLFDSDFETEMQDWMDELAKWLNGGFQEKLEQYANDPELAINENEPMREFCEWHSSPPDPDYCRPRWDDDDRTWIQVYETVSEGTPVTPPFPTPEELVDYLATHGDFWDQQRGDGPWSRENAETFVSRGWAPSLIVNHTATETTIKEPRDG